MYDNEVIAIVNTNKIMVRSERESKARYRARERAVKRRVVGYVGAEAVVVGLTAVKLISPLLAVPIMCYLLFVMGVYVGVNNRIFFS